MSDPLEVLFTCPECKTAWRSHGLTLHSGRMCDPCRKKLAAPPPFVKAFESYYVPIAVPEDLRAKVAEQLEPKP